jgi:hypothetical protein
VGQKDGQPEKPASAPYLTPKYTGLRCDLERERLISNMSLATFMGPGRGQKLGTTAGPRSDTR